MGCNYWCIPCNHMRWIAFNLVNETMVEHHIMGLNHAGAWKEPTLAQHTLIARLMGLTWDPHGGLQNPGRSHGGSINLAIWDIIVGRVTDSIAIEVYTLTDLTRANTMPYAIHPHCCVVGLWESTDITCTMKSLLSKICSQNVADRWQTTNCRTLMEFTNHPGLSMCYYHYTDMLYLSQGKWNYLNAWKAGNQNFKWIL